MSIAFITKKLLQELAVRTQSYLTSMSGSLSDAALESLASTEVDRLLEVYPDLTLKSNNDLGILAAHLSAEFLARKEHRLDDETAYTMARKDDALTDTTMNQLAYRMARVLGRQVSELRDTVRAECATLTNTILTAAPVVDTPTKWAPAIEVFNWGRLAEPTYRADAVRVAREVANVLHTTEVRPFFQSAILSRMEDDGLMITPPDAEDDESEVIMRGLLPKDDPAAERAIQLVTRRGAFREFVMMAKHTLEHPGLEHTIADLTMDASAISQHIDTLALRNISTKLSRTHDANIDRVRDMLALTHAAILCAGVQTYADTLIMPSTKHPDKVVVNQLVYNDFVKQGHTDADIVNHHKFLKVKGTMAHDRVGVAATRIIDQKDVVGQEVAAFESAQISDVSLENQDTLTRAMTRALNTYNESYTSLKLARCDQNAINTKLIDRAAVEVADPNRALHDTVTDYLVQLRGSPILSQLYRETRDGLHDAVMGLEGQDATLSKSAIGAAMAKAAMATQLTFIATRFGEI